MVKKFNCEMLENNMKVRLILITLGLLLVGCGGSGSSDNTSVPTTPEPSQNNDTAIPPDINPDPTPYPTPDPTPDPTPEPDPDTGEDELVNVVVPEQFDWSMYQDDTVKIKTVSNTVKPDGELAGLGGKHFLKIVALDADKNDVEQPLQRSLTNRTGSLLTKLKFPSEWYGIRVEVTVGNEVCTKTFSKDQVSGDIEVPCDIEILAGDGE